MTVMTVMIGAYGLFIQRPLSSSTLRGGESVFYCHSICYRATITGGRPNRNRTATGQRSTRKWMRSRFSIEIIFASTIVAADQKVPNYLDGR
jgi:hypothetical protein